MAGGTFSFGGLASGLDTKSIIEKLVEVKKKQLITPTEDRIVELSDQKNGLAPVVEKLNALRSAAKVLSDNVNNVWQTKTATSSDTDIVNITSIKSSKALAGTYNISDITQLAQADRILFNGVADKNASQFGTGTFTISYKGDNFDVTIDSNNNTLEGIVSAINSEAQGVTASIINDGDSATPYRLVLTSDDTGADAAITQDIASVLSLTVDAVNSASAENEPQDAQFKINGVSMSSSSNTVTEAIQGIGFQLIKEETTDTIALTVTKDPTAITTKISDFVTKYAEIKGLLKDLTLPDENGKMGILGSDITLSSSSVNVTSIMGTIFKTFGSSSLKSLSEIGIGVDYNGKVQIDAQKLQDGLDTNLEDVQKIFQGNTLEDGVAEKMDDFIYSLTGPAGLLTKKINQMGKTLTELSNTLDDKQQELDDYQSKLFTKFNALEKVIATLNARQSQVESFSGIYTNNGNKLY